MKSRLIIPRQEKAIHIGDTVELLDECITFNCDKPVLKGSKHIVSSVKKGFRDNMFFIYSSTIGNGEYGYYSSSFKKVSKIS